MGNNCGQNRGQNRTPLGAPSPGDVMTQYRFAIMVLFIGINTVYFTVIIYIVNTYVVTGFQKDGF